MTLLAGVTTTGYTGSGTGCTSALSVRSSPRMGLPSEGHHLITLPAGERGRGTKDF